MKNKKKYHCPHCEEEFTLIWEQEDLEPISCIFCGGALDNGDEEELLEEQEDDEDNWN
jgi:Zn ribbon nucleic-acid-binding protein|tara:strand:- start:20455 stop:20628 length:174 start_codon:yes stop_codon:yes gene_type:complete